MNEPREQDAKERAARGAGGPFDFAPGPQAPLTVRERDATTTAGADAAENDHRAARVVAVATVIGAVVAAGGIEWAGWQIVYRLGDPSSVPTPGFFGVPGVQWALGSVRNASLALGVGLGSAPLTMLFPWSRRRPWRAAAAAFAIGTATVLVALGLLTTWAP